MVSGKMKRLQKSMFSCQRDGLTLCGTEYRPEGDNLPIAIVCHGFMANQGRFSIMPDCAPAWAMPPIALISAAAA